MTLGEYIFTELANKNLNQADLSRMTNTTEATISRVVRGDRRPSIKLCHAIAKALDVPANVVLTKAGIVQVASDYNDLVSSIAYKASMLTRKDQDVLLKIIEALLDR